jgi:hypothetical protein
MGKPYVFHGPPRDYHHLGRVNDGEVAYFEARPPDDNWTPWEAPEGAEMAEVDPAKVERHEQAVADEEARFAAEQEALKQPNKAASADDWRAFAAAHGGFQEATGVHPDDATRKAIVDHYAENPVQTVEGEHGSDLTGLPQGAEISAQSQTEPPADPAQTQE